MSNLYMGCFAVFVQIEEIIWSFYKIPVIIRILQLEWIWTLKPLIYLAIECKNLPIG